jgi:hypothetical protein
MVELMEFSEARGKQRVFSVVKNCKNHRLSSFFEKRGKNCRKEY